MKLRRTIMSKGTYIIVGENIHCTRVRLTSGKFVEKNPDGSAALVFSENGEKRYLPIPSEIVEGDQFASGKVRHVAVAVQQGMYGEGEAKDMGKRYIQAMARAQEDSGAWYLDLNIDEFSIDVDEKIEAIKWAAGIIQEVSSVPLSIDSSEPKILEAGLEACDRSKGVPLVNSVSLERSSFIPIAAKAGASVIAGATGETSMPETLEDRVENISKLMKILKDAGIADKDIFLDPLVYPVSVNSKNALIVIDSIKALREAYGDEIHFAPGLSNISHGLPKRNVINQAFAKICLDAGCDGGIVDPLHINDETLAAVDFNNKATSLAQELLMGNDEYGMNYISAFREGNV
jgi:5-methyltetrahydrofolate--homocysteine methyltransferase